MKTSVFKFISIIAIAACLCPNTSSSQCQVSIPGNTAIYKTPYTKVTFSNYKGTDHNWVCSGDTLDLRNTENQIIYLEKNAVLMATLNDSLTVFMKTGSRLNGQSNDHLIVYYEGTASHINTMGSYDKSVYCQNTVFDYTQAPSGGCATTTGIVTKEISQPFSVITDAVNGRSTVQTHFNTSATLDISFVNILGKVLYQRSHTVAGGQQQLTVEHPVLASGIYFIRFSSGSEWLTQKLVVQ